VASGISTISVSQARVNPKVSPKPGSTDGWRQVLRRRAKVGAAGRGMDCDICSGLLE
jgi:hypothetical protein